VSQECRLESQSGLGWKGPLEAIQSKPSAVSRDNFDQTGLLRAPFNLAWNVPRDGASTTSLGNLGQGFTTLIVKNCFPISSLNLPSLSLKPSPLVLLQQALLKRFPLSFLEAPPGTGSCSKVSPQPSLPRAEQPQLSQPLLPAEGFQPSDHGWVLLWPRSHSSSSVLC